MYILSAALDHGAIPDSTLSIMQVAELYMTNKYFLTVDMCCNVLRAPAVTQDFTRFGNESVLLRVYKARPKSSVHL
jgi:hypothetical protein